MLIEPASIDQIVRSRSGKMVTVTDDVGGVARQLREIDSNLWLRYSEAGGYWVIYYHEPDDPETENGHLVLTALELDQRIVERVREIADEAYDYAEELDRSERVRTAAADEKFREQVGEVGERLAHALRKDFNIKNRIAVPKAVPSG